MLLINMVKRNVFLIIVVFIVIAVLLSIIMLNNWKGTGTGSEPNTILFEKNEGWGPCGPSDVDVCTQSTKLYYSGRLVLEGARQLEKQLDARQVNAIISKIKETGIMIKECPTLAVLDYSAAYKLVVDNQERTIQFPGCQDELLEIEALIPTE